MRISFLFIMPQRYAFLLTFAPMNASPPPAPPPLASLELLAPAGSWEALAAAAQGGADAVYFGIGDLNMRSHAAHTRFTAADLPDLVARCHDAGMRAYLALNTVLCDDDLTDAGRLLDEAARTGVDAVIAADLAAISAARDRSLSVHLSTQLNIANFESLRFFAGCADAAVLARELTLEQVAHIHRRIVDERLCGPAGDLFRIELFAHGALCMARSGSCYLSLHTAGHSANRGDCHQICRRSYSLVDNDTQQAVALDGPYLLSPKDLKTIRFLDRLVGAGVRIFKIEGRARGPEYVRTVTACYRQALDACRGGDFPNAPFDEWDRRLATVFNRGFWDGYYLGQPLADLAATHGSAATRRKVYLARVIKYFSRLGVAECLMESDSLAEGDDLLLTGPTTGALFFTAQAMRLDDRSPAATVSKGQRFSIATPQKVRPSDRIYKMVSAS
jgi:putative protease